MKYFDKVVLKAIVSIVIVLVVVVLIWFALGALNAHASITPTMCARNDHLSSECKCFDEVAQLQPAKEPKVVKVVKIVKKVEDVNVEYTWTADDNNTPYDHVNRNTFYNKGNGRWGE